MAHNIVIEKGDEMLENVTLLKPDTKVNLKSNVKYPTVDCSKIGGPVAYEWMEPLGESEVADFISITPARTPAGSDDSSDDSDEGG